MTTTLDDSQYVDFPEPVLEHPVVQPRSHRRPWPWIIVFIVLSLALVASAGMNISQSRDLVRTRAILSQVRTTLATAEQARDTAQTLLVKTADNLTVAKAAVYDLTVCVAALSASEAALADGDVVTAYSVLQQSGQPGQCQGAAKKADTVLNGAGNLSG